MGYSFFIFIFLCVLLPTINWILLYFIILILIWISFIYLWIPQFPPDNRNFIFSPRTRILFCKLDLFILSQIMCAVFRWFHHLLLLWIYKFIWIYHMNSKLWIMFLILLDSDENNRIFLPCLNITSYFSIFWRAHHEELQLGIHKRKSLIQVTLPPNTTSRWIPSRLLLTLLLYFIFIIYLLGIFIPSSQASLPFLSWWPLWEPTSQGSPHLQTQMQAIPVLASLHPYLISFSSFTLPVSSLLTCFFPGFLAIFIMLSSQQQQKQMMSTNNNSSFWKGRHSSRISGRWVLSSFRFYLRFSSRSIFKLRWHSDLKAPDLWLRLGNSGCTLVLIVHPYLCCCTEIYSVIYLV